MMQVIGDKFVAIIEIYSILLAEVWCIFHGLELARTLGVQILEVESDSYMKLL